MAWLEHRHYWRPKTGLNTVIKPGSDKAQSGLILEDCMCGAVRQIEFSPGEAPQIHITLPSNPDKA